MIKGIKQDRLTLEAILNKVDEYSLYRYYIGRDFRLNKAFCNPFRVDKSPSMKIMVTNGGFLYHRDFANDYYKGTITDLLKQVYGLSFVESLKKIDTDFGLGFNSPVKDYQAIIKDYKKPKLEIQRDTLIQVKAKKFTLTELAYWNQYGITLDELKKNNVYSPKEIYINKWRFPQDELCFCYLFQDKYWKIYQPKCKENKWRSNVPIDTMYGLSNIRNCEKAVVGKSLKDYIVLRKFFSCTCGVQNESSVAINKDNLDYLKNNSKETYICFDSDEPGKRNSQYYTDNHGFKHINVPDIHEEKDFAELAKNKGLQVVEDYFKSKGL